MSAIAAALPRLRGRGRRISALAAPELLVLLGGTAALNLWNLGINGWANTYYAAAVRSMSTSWHDFLFASLDKTGLMTVDKPPLALWVQALSARVFGFHPLSILVPQALMGVAAVALLYDIVRRRFGRVAAFCAGAAFALTPMTVAIARHNNPDELLILCSVAALWCALRSLETGRVRWIVLSGVCVGLGFEAKMGVALMVLPGIALAWVLVTQRARVKGLVGFLAATVMVGGAWPLLVTLTPAGDRPWISGTSDNSVWSLIFGYNGLGRVAGQTGGPQAIGAGGGGPGGGTLFGGPTGMFRLLQSGLGDQAGWLLGFAVIAGLGLLVLTRLRRTDPRTGWLIVVGGAFATTTVVFSFASGIFHPYYVSLLAPFTAALVGAGVGIAVSGARAGRVIATLAIVAGAVTELVVLHGLGGAMAWATPLVIAAGGICAVLLAWSQSRRLALAAIAVAMAALLAAPAVWAADTLGHAANGTFPAGGSAAAAGAGLPGGAGGFPGRGPGGAGGFPGRGPGGAGARGIPGGRIAGRPPAGLQGRGGSPPGAGAGGGFAGAGPGGFGGDTAGLSAAIKYVSSHGGGTIGVESQSSAATVILSSDADVAGLGGFSGRESSVTAKWISLEVRSGRLRWVLTGDNGQGFGVPGDTRTGSRTAFDAVAKACRAVALNGATLYDCRGRGAAIASAA